MQNFVPNKILILFRYHGIILKINDIANHKSNHNKFQNV